MKKLKIWGLIIGSLILFTACKSEEVKNVEALVAAVGIVSEDSEDVILEARTAYEALAEDDRVKVDNIGDLEAAEDKYDTIRADYVKELIDAIGNINDDSLASIELAREEYSNLTEKQKKKVRNYGTLTKAEDDYADHIYKKSIELFLAFRGDPFSDSTVTEAKAVYSELSLEKKTEVVKFLIGNDADLSAVTDIDEFIQKVRFKGTNKRLNDISYTKGEPSADDLNGIIAALQAYYSLNPADQEQIEGYKKLETALKGYSNYKKKRDKTDKLYVRDNYINDCKVISVEELLEFPKSYKGQQVSMDIQIISIEEGGMFNGDDIKALSSANTEVILDIRDKRKVKEPALAVGDTFTVYGTYEGILTVKETEEGSGLLGSNLFGKVSDEYDALIIEFTYSSIDNLGVIASGNPSDTDSSVDEEDEELKEELDKLLEELETQG